MQYEEIIIRGRESIYPAEVKTLVQGYPKAANTVVICVPDQERESRWSNHHTPIRSGSSND